MCFSDALVLDFGRDVPLGENRKCVVHVRNASAIAAPFSVGVTSFGAKPPTPPDGRPEDAHAQSKK